MLIGAAMQAGVPIRLDTPVYETMLGSVPPDLEFPAHLRAVLGKKRGPNTV